MSKPIVAIVGRPNVGKSTLFNKIVGRRLSIVEDTPGVIRDRIFGDAEWCGRQFSLVDTGGLEPASRDVLLTQMREQAQIAIDSASAIIFVTDLRTGVTATDQEVADLLLKSGRPVVLCVNKCDSVGQPPVEFYEFYNLGLGDPVMVSSVHGHGTGDLLDRVMESLPEQVLSGEPGGRGESLYRFRHGGDHQGCGGHDHREPARHLYLYRYRRAQEEVQGGGLGGVLQQSSG